MKIVQSFWSGNQSDFKNSYGWHAYKHNWLSWILSCNQLVKYHKQVELYTDAFGYDILINQLQLPYTKVHVVLDELNHYNKNLWAVGKIKTFQLQTEPFIHVDGDIFVWESLTDKFSTSNLVTQNLEITTDYYRSGWNIIHPQLTYMPKEMIPYHKQEVNLACNMGIIGGNNLDFFKAYCQKSLDFVDKNKIDWNKSEALNFNIFFEQVLFYGVALQNNEPIDYLFDEISKDNDYKGFGDFDKVPHKTYLHLLGVYKRNPYVCKYLEVYTQKHYPEQYSKLMKLINEEENNTNEITFLNKEKVKSLVDAFNSELKNNTFESENFLLKRDLYNEGLPNQLDEFLKANSNFNIVLLNCFTIKTESFDDSIFKTLEIEELNNINRLYELDEIDEIMIRELSRPVGYHAFISQMMTYFEEEDQTAKEEFLTLLNSRLRNYLILKIISIYHN